MAGLSRLVNHALSDLYPIRTTFASSNEIDTVSGLLFSFLLFLLLLLSANNWTRREVFVRVCCSLWLRWMILWHAVHAVPCHALLLGCTKRNRESRRFGFPGSMNALLGNGTIVILEQWEVWVESGGPPNSPGVPQTVTAGLPDPCQALHAWKWKPLSRAVKSWDLRLRASASAPSNDCT